MKKYLFKVKLRGVWLWCHASTDTEALDILTKQTGESLEEYCLEWQRPKNLDGSDISEAEYQNFLGKI